MTLKNYKIIKKVITVIIAIIFSVAVQNQNFFIPVIVLLISALTLTYLRKQVKEIIADERDFETGGKSALLAIQIYSWIAVICMFLLYSLKNQNPAFEPVAITLAFSTCILMLIYNLIFNYQNKAKLSDKKNLYIIFSITLILIAMLFTLRVFSGEDNWICDKGEWVTHGHPDYSKPTTECK